MCIAIAKMCGVDMPSKDILQRCWNNNPDGAGYAFNTDGVVCIKKGFMTFDAFWNSISEAQKRYDFKNSGVLIHFRIATHGGVIPAMTHPFPIVDDNGALSKLEYVSDYAVIHNGIISLTGPKARSEKAMSDTAVFIRDYLSKIAQNRQWFKRRANIELIEKLIDSKMAILNSRGEIIHTTGFTEDNGVLYSNSTYKDFRTRYLPNVYDDYDCYHSSFKGNNYGYDYLSGSYRSYRNTSVSLMMLKRNETLEGDMFSEECHDDKGRFAISKEGFVYEIIPDANVPAATSYGYGPSYSLEFLGAGKIYSGGKEKDFTPNYWPSETQFLGNDTPSAILEDSDPDYEEADNNSEQTSNLEKYSEQNK